MWTWSSVAFAGACCGGTTSATPAVVGECEHAVVAADGGGELAFGRWDDAGRVVAPSPREAGATGSVAVAARWARWGQASVAVPARWSVRTADELRDAGGGLGDLAASVRLDPWEERRDRPVPVLTLGLRAPTGRDWTEADGPLLADVTGQRGPGGEVAISVERSLGHLPFGVGLGWTFDEERPLGLEAHAALGRTLGPAWTVAGSLAFEADLASGGPRTTTAGIRAIRGEPDRWRAWLGATAGVPIAELGRGEATIAGLEAGLAWIR